LDCSLVDRRRTRKPESVDHDVSWGGDNVVALVHALKLFVVSHSIYRLPDGSIVANGQLLVSSLDGVGH
jgi:hypothetical protein